MAIATQGLCHISSEDGEVLGKPVSVLDRQVLFHSFHQVPEALAKDFLLGERLAVYQTGPQFTEILLVEQDEPQERPGY